MRKAHETWAGKTSTCMVDLKPLGQMTMIMTLIVVYVKKCCMQWLGLLPCDDRVKRVLIVRMIFLCFKGSNVTIITQ